MLVAAAAMVAAALSGGAAVASSRASGAWQVAVRRQLVVADDVRSGLEGVYVNEAPVALAVVAARLRADELGAAATNLTDADRATVLSEASAQDALAHALATGAPPLATDPRYLSADRLDVGRRLAEVRGPGAAAVPNPAVWVAKGDRSARQATAYMVAVIPVSVAFLLGALSGPFPALRRRLLAAGTVLVAAGVVWGATVPLRT